MESFASGGETVDTEVASFFAGEGGIGTAGGVDGIGCAESIVTIHEVVLDTGCPCPLWCFQLSQPRFRRCRE